jgi:hypothetical protein
MSYEKYLKYSRLSSWQGIDRCCTEKFHHAAVAVTNLVSKTRNSPTTQLGLKGFPFVERLRPIPSLKHNISLVLLRISFPIDRVLVRPGGLASRSVLL